MKQKPLTRSISLQSDNLKSKCGPADEKRPRGRKWAWVFAIGFTFVMCGAVAHAQTPFYQGKTITIVVGYLAGDGYDIWARLLAAHMGKHIPGNPGMIAQNMPGAGSMIAANHIYNVSKPDGLTMASIGPSLYLDQLIGKKEVQFDWARFGWVGSTENTPWLFYMNSNTPFKSINDVRKAKEAPKCSATGSGTSGHFIPKLLEEAVGAKFTVVMGYQGGAEQDLAFERGEVVCRALSIPTFLPASRLPPGARKAWCGYFCRPGASAMRECQTCRRFTRS